MKESKSELGVDVDNGFKPTYVASEDKSKVINQASIWYNNLITITTTTSKHFNFSDI